MPTVEQVLGPFGATVLLLFLVVIAGQVIRVLWQDHQRADADDRAQRDIAITGWREATDAIRALTAAVQEQDKREQRIRRDDP